MPPSHEEIRAEMVKISEKVDESMQKYIEDPQLGNIIQILTYEQQTTGKRLRPALATFISETLGGDRNETISVATACEMLHSASLMLDDSIDNDSLRRGKPTVHKMFGGGLAMMGTYVLALIGLEIGITKSNELGRLLVDTLRRLVVGGSTELAWEGWDEQEYYNIISNKTAALFEAPCIIGSITSGRPEYNDLARKYGNHVGLLYQLTDDAVDIYKSIKLKEPIGDIKNRITTLPIIYTYKHTNKPEVKMLLDLYRKKVPLPDHNLRLILYEVEELNALGALEEEIARQRTQAIGTANLFPKTEPAWEFLAAMPQFMYDAQKEEIDLPDFNG